jgi:hypothetical protein
MFGNNFYDKYGNFDNTKFIKLLQDAKKSRDESMNKKRSNFNQEITLFNSVSKKELWQMINKLSIFINS